MLNHDAIHWIPGGEGMNQAYLGAIHWKSQITGISGVEGPLELHQRETSFAFKVWAPLFTYPMLHYAKGRSLQRPTDRRCNDVVIPYCPLFCYHQLMVTSCDIYIYICTGSLYPHLPPVTPGPDREHSIFW